ncbi:MAG: YegS/Rv2252/BmrU family lipid kinase [Clostridia bacterium]|nr:YegS/Rv2252/BmrU family lipid kinase [Clostridia bacterium]
MNHTKTVLLIVNPGAGQCKIKNHLTTVIGIFNRADYKVITYITAKTGDAKNAVKDCQDKIDLVACCGGDGTLNEVVSGMMERKNKFPIGYIPTGSTNDFASTLNLSFDIEKAAKDIVEGKEKSFDVGQFRNRYFSYTASFGIFTKASYSTPQIAKNILGHTAYLLNGIQELSQLKSYPLKVELPNGEIIQDKFVFGAITNATSVGGVLKLSKSMVDLSDGQLELILIREPKGLLELTDCVHAIQTQTYKSDMIILRKATNFSVTATDNMDWSLDGEKENGHRNIKVTCLHKAICLITNHDI